MQNCQGHSRYFLNDLAAILACTLKKFCHHCTSLIQKQNDDIKGSSLTLERSPKIDLRVAVDGVVVLVVVVTAVSSALSSTLLLEVFSGATSTLVR